MSEMMWCDVDVLLPAAWGTDTSNPPAVIAGLCEELDGGYIECRDLGNGAAHWIMQGEANYGVAGITVDVMLARLREVRVPYVAADDGKYEYPGIIVQYDGAERFRCSGDTNAAWVDLSTVKALGSYDAVVAHLERAQMGVQSFSVAHLPATDPTVEG